MPTHPMTFGESNAIVKRLIANRRNLLISPDYSKDTAEICRCCVAIPPFQLADPGGRALVDRVLLANLM
jgi:hypothetical protein